MISQDMAKGNRTNKNATPPVSAPAQENLRVSDRNPAIGLFLFIFLIYAFTSAHSVTFEDSGLFISAVRTLGLPQPPGYPLYMILGHIMTYLPFGAMAYRVHLLSNLVAAGAVLFFFLSLRKLKFTQPVALLSAFALGLSDTFWSQAIVAEVYPLHIFIYSALFYCCLRVMEDPSRKNLLIFGGVYGLGLANHWPLLGLGTPLFILFAHKQLKTIIKESWIWIPFSCAVAAVFYLFMMWRSNTDVAISFLGPIHDLQELAAYINRNYYRSIEAKWATDLDEKIMFLFDQIYAIFWREWLLYGGVMGVAGLYAARKRFDTLQLVGIAFVILSTPIVLPQMLQFDFNSLNQNVIKVFHLVGLLAAALIFATGLEYLLKKQSQQRVLALAAALLMVAGLWNYKKNDLRTDHLAEDYARLLLDIIPVREKSTALVAGTDADVGPLSYVRYALNERQDLRLFTQSGVFFANRIFDPFMMIRNVRVQKTEQFVRNEGLVYSTKVLDILEGIKDLPFDFHFNGLFYEVSTGGVPYINVPPSTVERAKQILTDYIANPHEANWYYHREVIASRLCNFVILRDDTHPAFKTIRSCQQVYARHLTSQRKYAEADSVYRQLISTSDMMIKAELHVIRYHQLINRLDWINSEKKSLEEKLKQVGEAVEFATPALYEYRQCGNSVETVIRSLKGQVPFTPRTEKGLSFFDKCPKTKPNT